MISRVIILLTITINTVNGQDRRERELVVEGDKLYKSEMASWYGTDIFLKRFPGKMNNSGGYFSYISGENTNCIFFSKDETPKVLATISFDTTYNVETALVDSVDRDLTTLEMELFSIRWNALSEIRSDTLFRTYKNTDLNMIPISDEKGKRVYIMTGPKTNGYVLFGNDYLITYNKNGEVETKSKLHEGLIPINYGGKDGKIILATMHTHLPIYSDYITATDICTLKLYEKFAKWGQHIVMSKDFVSVWDCKADKLFVLTKKAWDKIYSKDKYLPKK